MSRRAAQHPGRAFTLVELVMVLAIMALVAALAVPRYANSIARYRAEMAARRVAADLTLASAQARQLGKPVTVVFNTSTGTYSLSGVEQLSRRAGDYTIDLKLEPYRTAISSVSFGASAAQKVIFNIYGQPDADGKVVLQCGAFTSTALLDQSSGKATVQQ